MKIQFSASKPCQGEGVIGEEPSFMEKHFGECEFQIESANLHARQYLENLLSKPRTALAFTHTFNKCPKVTKITVQVGAEDWHKDSFNGSTILKVLQCYRKMYDKPIGEGRQIYFRPDRDVFEDRAFPSLRITFHRHD